MLMFEMSYGVWFFASFSINFASIFGANTVLRPSCIIKYALDILDQMKVGVETVQGTAFY